MTDAPPTILTTKSASLPLLVVWGGVAGIVASTALTAPLAADYRMTVGEWGALVVFLLGAIPLAVVDARSFRLPNRGTFPLAAALAGYWLGTAITTGGWARFVQAIVCAVVIAGISLLIGMVGTLAFGDIKLMLAIGLLTGWVSWMLPLYALLVGYVLAVPHATVLLLQKRRSDTGTQLPFGPYLIAGAIVGTAAAMLLHG